MPEISVLAFSTAKQVMGLSKTVMTVQPEDTVESLLNRIVPEAREKCGVTRVALDQKFANWTDRIDGHKELALIPPVSGG